MARKMKYTDHTGTVSECIDDGLAELQSLGEEMREWADNMENGNLGATQKCQDVGAAADTLEGLDTSIEVPDSAAEEEVKYQSGSKGRSLSRSLRRDNAVAMLQAARDRLEELKYEAGEDSDEDFDSPIDSLESVISEAEGVEFPGMYG